MHRKTYDRLCDKLNVLTLRWGRSEPLIAKFQAQLFNDMNSIPAALDVMIQGLRSLPSQSSEKAALVWAALEVFETRYYRLMSESQRDRLYAALPPPPPDPPRIHGGIGTQRRYRPPRPASRRHKMSAVAGATVSLPRA
jgi:hypothetical protein